MQRTTINRLVPAYILALFAESIRSSAPTSRHASLGSSLSRGAVDAHGDLPSVCSAKACLFLLGGCRSSGSATVLAPGCGHYERCGRHTPGSPRLCLQGSVLGVHGQCVGIAPRVCNGHGIGYLCIGRSPSFGQVAHPWDCHLFDRGTYRQLGRCLYFQQGASSAVMKLFPEQSLGRPSCLGPNSRGRQHALLLSSLTHFLSVPPPPHTFFSFGVTSSLVLRSR